MIALTIPIKCKTIVHSGPSRQRGEHPQHAGHAPAAPLHSADPVVASLREHVKGTEKRLRYHYLWGG